MAKAKQSLQMAMNTRVTLRTECSVDRANSLTRNLAEVEMLSTWETLEVTSAMGMEK